MVGMLRRMAAISIPGVILSQLEMQMSASAQCAFTMYSTLSAKSASVIPVARQSERAPAMFRPCVDVRLR
jgi:hypothetical protein